MIELWNWIGVVGMVLGSVYFGLGAARATRRQPETIYTLNFFICLIAAGLYLTMATGYGVIEHGDGTQTAWIRYVTWILSTPLLLLNLTVLGRTRTMTTVALLGANTYMIATGFVATVVAAPSNYLWYIVSCGAYAAVVYLLLGPYRRQATDQLPDASPIRLLLTIHLALWTCYPLVWIVSPEGLGLAGSGFEAMVYAILDVAAKVGFGFLALSTMRKLGTGARPEPSRAQRPAASTARS